MFTSKTAAMQFFLTSCLLPVLFYADDNVRERDGEDGKFISNPILKAILIDDKIG
jgi:hypothetical protein